MPMPSIRHQRHGSAENAGLENAGPMMSSLRDQKCSTGKCSTGKCRTENAGPENSGLENKGPFYYPSITCTRCHILCDKTHTFFSWRFVLQVMSPAKYGIPSFNDKQKYQRLKNDSRRRLPAAHVRVVRVRSAIRNCHDWNTLFSQLTLAQCQTISYTIKIRPREWNR